MRKIFWGGAVFAVAAAAGLYLAADHASRHHDSFLGRFMIGAYQAALYGNPSFFFLHSHADTTCASVPEAPSTSDSGGPVTGCAAVEIRVPRQSSNADQAATVDVVDLTAYRMPGRIAFHEEEEIPLPTFNHRPDEGTLIELSGAAVELIPPPTLVEGELPLLDLFPFPGSTEESADPVIMPPAEDNPAPATMPYADEDEAPAGDFFKFWKRFFRKMAGSGDCCKDHEESELPRKSEPPDCRMDPHHHQQYPGCPYHHCPQSRNYCPHSGHSIIPAVEPKPRPETEQTAPPNPEPLSSRMSHPWTQPEEECTAYYRPWGVDTMEFRPTDARPEEFGLVPF